MYLTVAKSKLVLSHRPGNPDVPTLPVMFENM